jgi:hypothetical protein
MIWRAIFFLGDDQLRVACQWPLQFPPESRALQWPAPVLPPSLPLPVATDPPAEILTATPPPRPTLPDTSAAPAVEMRPPEIRNG